MTTDHALLKNLFHVASRITGAERGLVVDDQVQILTVRGIPQEELESQEFDGFSLAKLREALHSGEAIIANNIFTDVAEAPTTNTNFAELRIAVALPINGYGAIYLDRYVTNGVITRQTMEQFMRLVDHVLSSANTKFTYNDLLRLYAQFDSEEAN